MKYAININGFVDEGGSAEFYTIKGYKNLGFKQFRNKKFAEGAWNKQKLLSKFNLAPKVLSKVIKLSIDSDCATIETNWGFITEKAKLLTDKTINNKMQQIQKLVDRIYDKTGLKFWDCHSFNMGYIKRNNKAILVCIDTGNESFLRDSNAWGLNFPGPFCRSCERFQCECSIY